MTSKVRLELVQELLHSPGIQQIDRALARAADGQDRQVIFGAPGDRLLERHHASQDVGQPLVVPDVDHAMHLRPGEVAVDQQNLLSRQRAGDAEAHGDGRLALAGGAGGDEHRARHRAPEVEQRSQPLERPGELGQRLALQVAGGARRQPPQPRQFRNGADDLKPDVALDVVHRVELLAEAFRDAPGRTRRAMSSRRTTARSPAGSSGTTGTAGSAPAR